MPVVNPLARELVFKIVYYGPGLGGKTTTLRHIHTTTDPRYRGKMVSLATPVDRTLYFDFLPIRVPVRQRMGVRLQLFTVPGQVYYNATRKLVLTGADGVVFVADSQAARAEANQESLENLRDNLRQHGRELADVPHVVQYNKRDLRDVLSVEEMESALNLYGVPSFATVALRGDGVYESLEAATRAVLEEFGRRAPEHSPPEDRRFEMPEGGLAEALRTARALEPSENSVGVDLSGEPNWQESRITLPGGLRPTPGSTGESGFHVAQALSELGGSSPTPHQARSSDDGRQAESPTAVDSTAAANAGPPSPAPASQPSSLPAPTPQPPISQPSSAPKVARQSSDESTTSSDSSDADGRAGPASPLPTEGSWGDLWRSSSMPPDAHEWETGVADAAAFSFAELWPGPDREQVQKLELALSQGDIECVVETADELVTRSLDALGTWLGTAASSLPDAATMIWGLGVDGRRYMEFLSLLQDIRSKRRQPTRLDAMLAYVFALQLQGALNRLARARARA